MSNQDSHFVKVFSLVIGMLATIAILLFFLARYVGSHTQGREILAETEHIKSVSKQLAPSAGESSAGHKNAAPATMPAVGAANSATAGNGPPGIPTTGKQLFEQTCSVCHGPGIAGAPKAGDKAAWASHIAKGLPTLYEHALHGFTGRTGTMPAKGGRPTLPDALVKRAVNYMVSLVDPALVKGKAK